MRISTKGEYGIRALIELARRYGDGYIQSSEIAAQRHIPENYLFQLLITLRKAGLIRSRRGPQGGHMLARPPERITLAEAVMALEGPFSPALCVDESVADDCPMHAQCVMRAVWQRITDSARQILDETNFGALCAQEAALRAQAEPVA
jgi:Rrf2 family transcriptional regulator, cysteine metabolism repressor